MLVIVIVIVAKQKSLLLIRNQKPQKSEDPLENAAENP